MENDAEKQRDELEVLSSVYGDQWKQEGISNQNFSIEILESEQRVIMYINLPSDYPSAAPPTYQISAPSLTRNDKREISDRLESLYLENIGESIIYQWIECIRSFLQEETDKENNVMLTQLDEVQNASALEVEPVYLDSRRCFVPEINHGEIIMDRKSTFQGHVATVTSIQDVESVLLKLKENKKIANATHNMYAFRIRKVNESTECLLQDCGDDGENHAGSRLLHLLQIMDLYNVLVVVSRWYGGVHLGPDRFRHINNAARSTLSVAGFTSKKK